MPMLAHMASYLAEWKWEHEESPNSRVDDTNSKSSDFEVMFVAEEKSNK